MVSKVLIYILLSLGYSILSIGFIVFLPFAIYEMIRRKKMKKVSKVKENIVITNII